LARCVLLLQGLALAEGTKRQRADRAVWLTTKIRNKTGSYVPSVWFIEIYIFHTLYDLFDRLVRFTLANNLKGY